MHEHETISEFNYRILTMVNDFFALGKPISEEEICRKNLRSAHPRYHPKILAIEEYTDISIVTRGSLIRKLMVYETNYLNLNFKEEKCIVLQAKTQVPITKPSEKDDLYVYIDNSLALIAENFNKMLKKKNFNKPRKTSTSVGPMGQEGFSYPNYKLFDLNKLEGIQCREHGGKGHIQVQCANTLMKKKAMEST